MAVLVVAAQLHLMEQFMPAVAVAVVQVVVVLAVAVAAVMELLVEQELLVLKTPAVVEAEAAKDQLMEVQVVPVL
jgi:hypothetical protein